MPSGFKEQIYFYDTKRARRENLTHRSELDELPFLTHWLFLHLPGGPELGGLFLSASGLISVRLRD